VRTAAAAKPQLKVLDFGCGSGEVVGGLRAAGVDAYGAETFYGGGDYTGVFEGPLFQAGHLRAIGDDGRVPFEDATFDLVLSNQVMEHVEDFGQVTAEIHRLLKPGGRAYHHFPSREVIREGHIGIPLAHRFAPGRARGRYVLALRRLGLGYNKAPGESPEEWTERVLRWLDDYTVYRSYAEIRGTVAPYFDVEHREIDYCRFRAANRPALRRVLSVPALAGPSQRAFRRLGFMAIELRKR
jgi:SAM-dependent methyltransferase